MASRGDPARRLPAHYRVVAPHFVAGITVAGGGVVTVVAPILRWAKGKTYAEFASYARRKGWEIERLHPKTAPVTIP
jgi:hypothetical protein